METLLIRFGAQTTFQVGEISAIAAVRRAGVALAQQLGLEEVAVGEVALLITEAGTNIVKHAGSGEMLLCDVYGPDGKVGVEIIAFDNGPGIDDVHLKMMDGQSTTGTYGIGLGTIARLSHEFDLYSAPENGSVLWMRLWSDAAVPDTLTWHIGAVCLPMSGEEVCGDAWTSVFSPPKLTFTIADGLGHGPDAARASRLGNEATQNFHHLAPANLLQQIHEALKGTRGAAVATAQIDTQMEQVQFAGIGNIAVSIFEEESRHHLISHNGIAGSNLRKVQEYSEPWARDALLIAHSDGINTRWDLNQYPGLRQCHPGVVAAVLYRDFCRGRDDVSVVAIRQSAVVSSVGSRQSAGN